MIAIAITWCVAVSAIRINGVSTGLARENIISPKFVKRRFVKRRRDAGAK
jgi:hypothetical protein